MKKLLILLVLAFLFVGCSVPRPETQYLTKYEQDDLEATMGYHIKPNNFTDYFAYPFTSLSRTLGVGLEGFPGIDVSKWQGVIDWQKAYDAGARFAFIRAGSADSSTCEPYTDSQFERNSVEAFKAGIHADYYWFFRPNCDANIQAQYFSNLMLGKEAHMYPVADVEVTGGLTPKGVHDRVWIFLDEIKEQIGRTTMVYTSPGFWNSNVSRNAWVHEYPLWVAHWGVTNPFLPYDWSDYNVDYTFWQTHVGDDGPEYGMESQGLDHNVYNGDYEKFLEEFQCQETPDECPPGCTPDDQCNEPCEECPTISEIIIRWSNGEEQSFRENFDAFLPIISNK